MNKINSIKFGLLGDEGIRKISVALINNPSLKELPGTVYDPSLGCSDVHSICTTCEKDIWHCPGHFGHISLGCEAIIFWKELVKFLKCFCHSCGRLMDVKISGTFDACLAILSKLTECVTCGAKPSEYKLVFTTEIYIQKKTKKDKTITRLEISDYKELFAKITLEDLKKIGINPKLMHPNNFILTLFPVLPIPCRPKVSVGNVFFDDDLSISLSQIIKLTWKLSQTPEAEKKPVIQQLQLKLLYYCNNSKGKDIHSTNNKVMLGIRERISKKTGLIRQNIMGKRADYTARSVVGPHPFLELDQVAIPLEIADKLTCPEYVTPFNKQHLSDLVEKGKAPYVLKKSGVKLSVERFTKLGSTVLNHGDIIDGEKISDCNMFVKPGTLVTRDGVSFPYEDVYNPMELNIGDIVYRYLQDGDPVVLNRQPTLHKNSMMGMRIKRWPAKTICVNLAITAGFNMDFDGDEGNLNLPQTPEAVAEVKCLMNANNHMLSVQSNKSAIVIVQDSLLGAYIMTRKDIQMSKAEFFDCLYMVTHNYPISRAEYYSSRQLWNFMFPSDFHYEQKGLVIRHGKLISGAIDKTHLKSGNNIIRLLHIEYSSKVASEFVTNVQRLVTVFLTHYPHSVSIQDCIIPRETKTQIDTAIAKYIDEANEANRVSNSTIREAKISLALNSAKDIGNRIAKEHLSKENKFMTMVDAGSKGDYFNLSQIMGLLGQQNIAGVRIKKEIDNGFRCLPYFPRVIFDDSKYEARGFVKSSFIQGLNPIELFFHTKAGREGMIDTSHRTGNTGYMERKMIKIMEDLVTHYDGTVRDGRKNIIQMLYGGYGFDPVTTVKDALPYPVDVQRLAKQMDPFAKNKLSQEMIDEILNECVITSHVLPLEIKLGKIKLMQDFLEKKLCCINLSRGKFTQFVEKYREKFNTFIVSPGESVGILAAQSIGEQQTQQMLNTFHTTGVIHKDTNRLTDILNMPRVTKNVYTKIFFSDKYTPTEIRYMMRDVIYTTPIILATDYHSLDDTIVLRLNLELLYKFRITHEMVTESLNGTLDMNTITFVEFPNWQTKVISGIKNITSYELQYDQENDEWYVITEGSNIAEILSLPFVDKKRFYSNDLWEIYDTLGIGAVREQIFTELSRHCNTSPCHISLLTDMITFKGKPTAVDRYTMRYSANGPLSKATFEESMDILTAAAVKTEVESNYGVSASIMVGNRIHAGTGFMDLRYKL